jgi:hypothetical protein
VIYWRDLGNELKQALDAVFRRFPNERLKNDGWLAVRDAKPQVT